MSVWHISVTVELKGLQAQKLIAAHQSSTVLKKSVSWLHCHLAVKSLGEYSVWKRMKLAAWFAISPFGYG